jgi:hypothetical protein
VPKIYQINTTKTVHNTYMLWVGEDENAHDKIAKLVKKINDPNAGILVNKFKSEDSKETMLSSSEISNEHYIKEFDKENPMIAELDVIDKMDFLNTDVTIYS